MVIDVGKASPINQAPYKIHEAIKTKVKKEIDNLLNIGVVVSSASLWASPVVPIRKPDGSVRLCIDYRKLHNLIRSMVFA